MLVRTHGFEVQRGVAEHVLVELDVGSARDTRERVRAAVLNSGFAFPRKRVTVNIAPASSKHGGSAFDLAIACCVLAAQDQLDAQRLATLALFAELGLGGGLRSAPAVAVAAEAAD